VSLIRLVIQIALIAFVAGAVVTLLRMQIRARSGARPPWAKDNKAQNND